MGPCTGMRRRSPVGRPDQPGQLADEGRQGRGVGDGVEKGVGAEVGTGDLDGEAEGGGEVVVVGTPLGSGDQAGHPDAVPGQSGGFHRAGSRERVVGAGEELDRFVVDPYGLDTVGRPTWGMRERAEGGVDRAGPECVDGRVGVEEGDDVELDVGVRAVEGAQQFGRREAAADDVDAQGAAARPYRSCRPFRGPEQFAGVGQERLSVDAEAGTARVRVNSRAPSSFSSAATRFDTACWVTASRSAASWNRPASATATKVRTASRSMPEA